MSLKVIELNDSAVTVSDESGLIFQSPGFAQFGDEGLVVGEEAEKQTRIRPTSSFNKFWHQLSMEPLGYSVGGVRHFADLAFAHLMHLADEAKIDGDVILAVPGNFTSAQLSILLGITSHCPFNPVGVVDAALANTIRLARKPHIIYADIQLHQALLTKFSITDGNLQRDTVIQIPEAGLQNFMDLTMQLATGLFIQQCRFNPQHTAESEQQLYNALPAWLKQHKDSKSSLLMEIKTASAIHQAKLPWKSLVQELAGYYARINQQLAALASEDNCQILVSASLAQLPDYIQSAPSHSDVQVVSPELLGKTCIELQQYIDSNGEGFHFVTRLPLVSTGASNHEFESGTVSEEPAPLETGEHPGLPTHVLFENHALPLGKVAIRNDGAGGTTAAVNGRGICLALSEMPDYLGQIEKEDDRVFMVCGEAGAIVNGEKVAGRKQLSLGDQITFNDQGKAITLIRVRDGV